MTSIPRPVTTRRAAGPAKPPCPGCPAVHGNGADLSVAGFTLVADDCQGGPGRQPAKTDVWGFFVLPGPEHDADVVLTAGLLVPAGSPIARLAHRAAASPARVARAGAVLRGNVARCPCPPGAPECPALDEVRLVEAIERAARLLPRPDPALNPRR